MRNYKIHFIRHGMTDSNQKGYFAGQLDIPLCEDGVSEIKEILSVYEYPYVDMVYCSPLLRARQTAEFIYSESPITIVEDLKELHMGDFQGRFFEDLCTEESYLNWIKDAANNPPPNAIENAAQFTARIYRGLNEIFTDMCQNQYYETALIAHNGVVTGLLSQFGYPKGTISQWRCENVRGFTIEISAQGWFSMGMFEVKERVGPPLREKEGE